MVGVRIKKEGKQENGGRCGGTEGGEQARRLCYDLVFVTLCFCA